MTPGTTSGSAPRPTERQSATSSEAVLDAAEAILGDGGFDQLSVRSIASSLGVSRQVVYTHFGGMDGLLDGLHRRLSHRLAVAVDGVEGDTGTTEHVLAAVAAYRDVARRWPELYQLVFERPVPEHQVGLDARDDGRRTFARVIDLAHAWLERNESANATPEHAVELARAIWSATHGFVVGERVGFAAVRETDGLSDRTIRAMLAGW